jgi:D-3-phosphoglycerate dehydrogenase
LPTFNVIVTEPINKMGVEYLKKRNINVIELPVGSTEKTLEEHISEADGLITRGSIKITRELMISSPRLKIIGVHGLGYGHVDITAAKELGKIVCNTPTAHTVTVAEMAMALTLALLRNVVSADKAVRKGQWGRKYSDLIGVELADKNVGIVGLGRIGTETAKRMSAFDARVSYWSRTRKPAKEEEYGFHWKEFDQLIKESDIISFHIPSTPETRHLIGAREIEDMKDGVFLINSARGKLIDEKALIKALKSGKVRAAALDVFENEPLSLDNPLCKMDNVILTPHLSASNFEGMQRMAMQIAEAVYQTLRGETPKNIVD